MTQLSKQDRQILEFVQEREHCLYNFLDAEFFAGFDQAGRGLARLASLGWVRGRRSETGGVWYRLTDLGKRCLETGEEHHLSINTNK